MADIRINALATTATTPASDDYLALDGTAQGTRKILATNIANNVTDVILGSSGPSVKSSLSARAPRQGLVFDGSAGATHSNITLGSGDFTVAVWARLPTTSAANRQLIGSSGGDSAFWLDTTGLTKIYIAGQATYSSSSVIPDQKWVLLAYTKSGTSGTFYQNAISNGTVTDSNNYSTAWSYVGGRIGGGYTTGTLIPLIYNRALSASEVVALYEAGAPAGADYNSASNTAINTSTVSSQFGGSGTLSSASATGFNLVWTSGNTSYIATQPNLVGGGYVGRKFRYSFTITVNSGTGPRFEFWRANATGNAVILNSLTSGTYSGEYTFGDNQASFFAFVSAAAVNYTVSNLSITALGLLLAPDAAQAGGGLTWYDTSGNAANITLPASGVSWNVPSSRVLGGNWTNTGTLSATGSQTADTVPYNLLAGGNKRIYIGYNTTGDYGALNVADTGVAWKNLVLNQNGGNVLVGGVIDTGQKFQVSGTAYVSGNTLFGGNLTVGSATTPKGKIDAQAAYDGSAPSTSSTPIIRANNGGAISLWMGGNAYSYMWMQAIQDDGSNNIKNINFQPLGGDVNFGGNATFAGDVFSTKSINIASGYSLTAQDSGNTYRTILRGIADNTVEIGWGTATPTNGHLIFKAGGTEQGRINPAGGWILGLTASAPVLGTNSTMTFELTSNTSLTIKVRGTDGTTRSATLTLS